MKTVEEITEKVEKTDPLVEQQIRMEAEQDTLRADLVEKLETGGESGKPAGITAAVSVPPLEGLNALLTRGADGPEPDVNRSTRFRRSRKRSLGAPGFGGKRGEHREGRPENTLARTGGDSNHLNFLG